MTKRPASANYRPFQYDEARACYFQNRGGGRFYIDEIDGATLQKGKHLVQKVLNPWGIAYIDGINPKELVQLSISDYLVRVERQKKARPEVRVWRVHGFDVEQVITSRSSDALISASVRLRDVPFRPNVRDWQNEQLCWSVEEMLKRVGYTDGVRALLAVA